MGKIAVRVSWKGTVKKTSTATGITETITHTGTASGSDDDYRKALVAAHSVASEGASSMSLSHYASGYNTTHTITYTATATATADENYYSNYSIEIDGITRNYLLVNINPNDVSNININNVLLCFPGGGETNTEFINYTAFNYIGSPVIVFLGQQSINTYTWQNAFPWLYNNFNQNGVTITYQNDVNFVDTVLSNLFGNTIPELFLTGKSDGGGFCVLYSNISKYKSNIKAIGICSSAHFGLNSIENIDSFNISNCFTGNNNTIIPYNIILPPPNISVFIIHGTGDTTMPYIGQPYKEEINSDSLWKVIDSTFKNTYTVNIPTYIQEIVKTNNFSNLKYDSSTDQNFTNQNYSYSVYSSNNNQILNFITINNQDHDWSGHYNSGPNSNEPSNFTMDATYLMIKFFKLEIGNYKPTVTLAIPSNLLNYNNEIINE
jgi:poly(3-hydroxybutyrate) depolymerase